ncbi:colicin E1 family microcin immunity protein [Staphylococcus cornubiensis]
MKLFYANALSTVMFPFCSYIISHFFFQNSHLF